MDSSVVEVNVAGSDIPAIRLTTERLYKLVRIQKDGFTLKEQTLLIGTREQCEKALLNYRNHFGVERNVVLRVI